MPRSTIHYYLRGGLLPCPQKTAGTRSLYSDDHVAVLERIAEAKAAGHSLTEIRAELQPWLRELEGNPVDLGAQEYGRIHREILEIATKDFVRKGYRGTRLADIIRRSGVSSSVFYVHFPTKRHLLVESYCTFIEWSVAYVEPRVAGSSDMVERLLARSATGFSLHALDSDVLALVNSDTLRADPELLGLLQKALHEIDQNVGRELAAMRSPGTGPAPIPPETLSYVLGSAFQAGMRRVASDPAFPLLDLLRTLVWLWLAVQAGLSGQVDVDGELARYEERIREVTVTPPPLFPALEG